MNYWILRKLMLVVVAISIILPNAWDHHITSTNAKSTNNNRYRINDRAASHLSIEPYVRPRFARTMEQLQPQILAAAARHNRPELSKMSDAEFAVVIAIILYNENFGWFEDEFPSVRKFTPLYQYAQIAFNQRTGSNLSVWPANLRPSVAAEILYNYIPTPPSQDDLYTTLKVHGSNINLSDYQSVDELYQAINKEISNPELAVEYLAANLERGIYRAHAEGVSVTWRSLAAWHNQGIVSSEDIQNNPTAKSYLHRSSAYIPKAYDLIYECQNCQASAPR